VTLPEGTRFIELNAYDVGGNLIARFDRTELINDDSFTAYKATSEPAIDGLANEDFWDDAEWYPLEYVWLPYNDIVDAEDFTGRFKLSWNEDHLLMLVEITDDVLSDIYSDPLDNYWNDDCVEVFLDEDHSGGPHMYSFTAFAYHISTSFDVVDHNASGVAALFNDHIESARTAAGNTYTWEHAISIYDDSYTEGGSNTPVTLEHEKEMGFSLAYCDNDVSATRENFIGSKYLPEAQSNDSYLNASLFGTLTLIDPDGPEPEPEPEFYSDREVTQVFIYPNPADDIMYYDFIGSIGGNVNYAIRSMTGELLLSGSLNPYQRNGVLDIRALSPGMYLVLFSTDDINLTKRIIKQ